MEMTSEDRGRTKGNQVLETFAELYLEAKGLEDYSIDGLESVPEEPVETYLGWEYDSDHFWEYQTEIADEIDKLVG